MPVAEARGVGGERRWSFDAVEEGAQLLGSTHCQLVIARSADLGRVGIDGGAVAANKGACVSRP